jgi:tetratricopeptide (TPR) repeat protein
VVEGSVRKLDDILRLNVQLVSTESGAQLWADRFDEPVKDLSAGQEEIVQQIGQAMGVALIDIESARSKRERPTNPDAFDLVLRARAVENQTYSDERLAAARALYERALQLDRDSVDAKARLADTLLDSFTTIDMQPDDGTLERVAKLVEDLASLHPDAHEVLHLRAYLPRVQQRWPEAIAASERLIELYPNDEFGYNNLAACKLATGAAAEAIPLLEQSIRLSPRHPALDNRYERVAFATLLLGRNEETIVWEQRALAANPDARARERSRRYLMLAAAFALAGHREDAHRAIAEANRLWPYATVRSMAPTNPSSPVLATQVERIREGLRLAGLRDHAEEDADFHIASDDKLTDQFAGPTPTTMPGASTIRTTDLAAFLAKHQPIVIDTALYSWGRSIPGAIGLRSAGVGGSLSGSLQTRLGLEMQALTHGDRSLPIVAVGFNAERFDGRNLALRLVALGYTQVYWYRGGREAWEVNGLPETEFSVQDW